MTAGDILIVVSNSYSSTVNGNLSTYICYGFFGGRNLASRGKFGIGPLIFELHLVIGNLT